ncbi:hypothetical protein IM40_02375 [Candidatus Paracaedimonas acanthamoebae]|nr:hypothetical protein IM40_02375 [Candidatus Paracaedimonas acanthamoebae]
MYKFFHKVLLLSSAIGSLSQQVLASPSEADNPPHNSQSSVLLPAFPTEPIEPLQSVNISSGSASTTLKQSSSEIDYDEFTKEHVDYIRLRNIRYLLRHKDKINPHNLLLNISWQTDGMTVLKRSLRDRSVMLLPIWSKLSYLHRAISLSIMSPQFREAFIQKFVPLLNSLPEILKDIEEVEKEKATIRKMMTRLPDDLARKTFSSVIDQTVAASSSAVIPIDDEDDESSSLSDDDDSNEEGSSASSNSSLDPLMIDLFKSIAKHPIQDELRQIKKCTLYTHEYQFKLSMECLKNYMQASNAPLEPIEQAKKIIKQKEEKLVEDLKKSNKLASAEKIERLVGVCYEYESLIEALENLTELEKMNVTGVDWRLDIRARRLLFQTITLTGEALNNVSTPLEIEASQDVLRFIPSIKYLRNVFEHPLDFKRKKFKDLLEDPTQGSRILKGLSLDLLKLRGPLTHRLKLLQNLLQSDKKCDKELDKILSQDFTGPKELGTQPGNVPKNYNDLLAQAHWQDIGLKYVQWLRRYFYHPTYLLNDPETENLNEIVKQIVKQEKKAQAKSSDRTVTIDQAAKEIGELSVFLSSYPNRIELIKDIHTNRSSYAYLINLITQIFSTFNTMVEGHDLDFYIKMRLPQKKMFESVFNDLRERRNFSVHDLWRKDFRGLAKVSYLLVHNLLPILSPSQPTALNEATLEMWKQIDDLSITSDSLLELLARGADINSRDPQDSHSALAYAVNQASNYQDPVVRAFLKNGADPNLCDDNGTYPIHVAAEDARIDLIMMLFDAGAIPDVHDFYGNTPEDSALSNDHEDVAKLLRGMQARFRGDKADKLHLHLDPTWFDSKYLHPLRGRNPNLLNADGELPLVLAIEKSASTNDSQKVFEIVYHLLKAGAEVNKHQSLDGATALISAAQYSQDLELFSYLLDNGAEIDAIDNSNSTALHYAAKYNDLEFVRLLLDKKASVHLRDNLNRTPLLAAADTLEDHLDIIELLLKAGANPNDEDEYGSVCHYISERNGDLKAAQLLLKHGAKPNKIGSGAVYGEKLPHEVAKTEEMKNLLKSALN